MMVDAAKGVDTTAGSLGILTVCLAAAMIEGFDLQAAGVAAPKLAPILGLTPGQMGLFFSSATFGLVIGAIVGGRIADRFGRRFGIATSLVFFGLFSFATAFVPSFPVLIMLRFLTGLGLGGALPNLVAIASEAASTDRRGTAVGITYAGLPLGGAVVSGVAIGVQDNWQLLFIIGGILPILLVPVILRILPWKNPAQFSIMDAGTSGPRSIFGQDTWLLTVLLWIGFFFSVLVLYLLLNWLPLLMVSKGFSGSGASMVQAGFNLAGAAASIVMGILLDTSYRRSAVLVSVAILLVSMMFFVMIPNNLVLAVISGMAVGIGIVSVQSALYSLAPQSYRANVRGTGVGLAIAVGRFGSVVGPLLAGVLIAGGKSSAEVLIGIIPLAVIGGISTFLLVIVLGRRLH